MLHVCSYLLGRVLMKLAFRSKCYLHCSYKISQWVNNWGDAADEKVLEMDGRDGCITMRMYLMPLNWLLNDQKGYVTYVTNILPE